MFSVAQERLCAALTLGLSSFSPLALFLSPLCTPSAFSNHPRPKVLKYLPGDKAADAKSFMMSFQYWLGGSPENLEAFMLMLADK